MSVNAGLTEPCCISRITITCKAKALVRRVYKTYKKSNRQVDRGCLNPPSKQESKSGRAFTRYEKTKSWEFKK